MRVLVLLVAACGFQPRAVVDATGGSGDGSDATTGDSRHRKPLTLAVDSPTMLDDFVASIVTVDPDLAARAPDPGQIAFTAMDGTPLSREIVGYDHTTGALEAWVRIPHVADTITIYMTYGPGAPAEPMHVWDGYVATWHLAEPTGPWLDSVAGHMVASPSVGETPAPSTAGIVGAARTFDGDDDYTTAGSHDVGLDLGSGSFTLQAWVNVDTSANGFDEVLYNGGDNGVPGYMLTLGTGSWYAYVSDGTERHAAFGTEAELLHHWNQLTAVVDRATSMLNVYVNGVYVTQVTVLAMGSVDSTSTFEIGTGYDPAKFEGTADEIRLAKFAFSADRIAAEYRNISQRTAFVTFAGEETF